MAPSCLSPSVGVFAALALLLLAETASCVKFYAYPIALKADPTTGALTRERVALSDVPFWKVCVPSTWQPPNPQEFDTTGPEDVRTLAAEGNKESFKVWLKNSEVRLVSGNRDCGEDFTQDGLISDNMEIVRDIPSSHYEAWRPQLFDPTKNFPRGSRTAGEMRSSSWGIGYDMEQYQNFMDWFPQGDILLGGHDSQDVDFLQVGLQINLDEDFEKRDILAFNTDMQMGAAQSLEMFRDPPPWLNVETPNRGMGLVDWHLDRNLVHDYDLVACASGSRNTGYRRLYMMRRNLHLRGNRCMRIMLTTSPNQVQHMKDLWNQRQTAWTRFKILFEIKPFYLPQYGIRRMYPGKIPVLYKLDDPNRDPIHNLGEQGLLPEATPMVLDMDDGLAPAIGPFWSLRRGEYRALSDIPGDSSDSSDSSSYGGPGAPSRRWGSPRNDENDDNRSDDDRRSGPNTESSQRSEGGEGDEEYEESEEEPVVTDASGEENDQDHDHPGRETMAEEIFRSPESDDVQPFHRPVPIRPNPYLTTEYSAAELGVLFKNNPSGLATLLRELHAGVNQPAKRESSSEKETPDEESGEESGEEHGEEPEEEIPEIPPLANENDGNAVLGNMLGKRHAPFGLGNSGERKKGVWNVVGNRNVNQLDHGTNGKGNRK